MRFRLPQTCVYWAPARAGVYGRPGFEAPVQLPCRWEDGTSDVVSSTGDVVQSTARVFLASEAKVSGMLMKGLLEDAEASSFPEDPRQDARVKEILSADAIPSITAGQSLYTAHLK